jgi:restriction system protein
MLGKGSNHAKECFENGFIGVDFDIDQDLSEHLHIGWKEFRDIYNIIYLQNHPDKSKVAAGLACGFIFTMAIGIAKGDIVLCPDGSGSYRVGEVTGGYYYRPGEILPHRRPVNWRPTQIARLDISPALKAAAGAMGTISNVTRFGAEFEKLLNEPEPACGEQVDADVEDASTFALEKHLEDFLVVNWAQTELGRKYNIWEGEGELVGQQYPTDTGAIDILAISKDNSEWLVVELKKGRASDRVVGQIQRYMGFVLEKLAETNQKVSGAIIAQDDDPNIRRALLVAPNISFYKYVVSFKLTKG